MQLHGKGENKSREVPPEFAMTFMGSLLTFLIVMLLCVLVWMWIKCLLGVRTEYFNKEPNMETIKGQLKESAEDLKSGNPMTYHPTFMTIRHSYLSHPLYFTHT